MSENLNKKGVTLIEVLISLFIIAILSTLVFVVNNQNKRQYAILQSANKLAQDIRLVQQMSMTTSKCCGGITPDGYGVFFSNANNTNYILYADRNNDQLYDVGDTQIGDINPIPLETGVEIVATTPNRSFSINFKPPDPIIRISNGLQNFDEGSVTLQLLNSSSATRTIHFNSAGLINITVP